MNTKICTTLATALLALTALPATADPGNDDLQTVWGTTGFSIKGLGSTAFALCTVDFGIPTDCGEPVPSRGQAYFDLTGWNGGVGGGREVTVWAEQTSGAGTGFTLLACSDLANDFVCDGGDPVEYAYSHTVDPDGDGCDKDDKDCGDPTTAGLTICVPRDLSGSWDELAVFILHYVDAESEENDDLGVGVSEGTYDVTLDYGAYVASC